MGAVQTTNSPSYESVLAIIQNNAIQIEKLQKSQRKTTRQMKESDKRFGFLSNRFGDIVEYMVAPNLCSKFNEFGFDFLSSANQVKYYDLKHNIKFEIDVFLQNSEKAMLVEVKTKPSYDDIEDHIERLNKMRKYANLHNDKRVFFGAIAGVVIPDKMKNFILKKGLYLVEPSGESFNITAPGKPKEW